MPVAVAECYGCWCVEKGLFDEKGWSIYPFAKCGCSGEKETGCISRGLRILYFFLYFSFIGAQILREADIDTSRFSTCKILFFLQISVVNSELFGVNLQVFWLLILPKNDIAFSGEPQVHCCIRQCVCICFPKPSLPLDVLMIMFSPCVG